MHTAEPLPLEPTSFEVEFATENLKIYTSPGTDQIPAELIQAGGNTLCSGIYKLLNSVSNREELPQRWKESIIVPIYRTVIKLTVVIIQKYQCYQLHRKLYPILLSQG
jgi:hypothetical protein